LNLLNQRIAADSNIFLGGDDHDGNPASHTEGVLEMVNAITEPYDGISPQFNYFWHFGDIVESITIDDPRFDPQQPAAIENASPIRQINNAVETYKPISKKIICLLDGNHPRKLSQRVGPITQEICRRLECPYGDYTAKVTFSDIAGTTVFKMYGTHGRRGVTSNLADPAQAWASKQRSLKNAMRELAGDCLVMAMGHTHQLIDVPPHDRLYLYDDGERLHQDYVRPVPAAQFIHPDQRWYVNTGSFFRTQMLGYATYGELAQYAPVPLGYYVLKIRDYKPVGLDRVLV